MPPINLPTILFSYFFLESANCYLRQDYLGSVIAIGMMFFMGLATKTGDLKKK